MANESTSKELEIQKQEVVSPEERTRDRRAFIPHTDIYETDDQIVVVADIPGAGEENIDITLEKNILSINAYIEPEEYEDYSLALAEYEIGDYQRTFRLSDEIDTDNINATVKDGVLRLYLPKAAKAMTKKISVQVV
jgi:HSP20 family protein